MQISYHIHLRCILVTNRDFCMLVSCSQLQISDSVRYCDDPLRCKSSQRVCRGVASTRTHVNVFYIIYFFTDEGVPVSCVASHRSVYVLQLQILATARCNQLLRVCRALKIITRFYTLYS